MNKEFGHWDLLCDEPTTWESFVYLMIDTNGKMYIGAKTKTKKWQTYSISSRDYRTCTQTTLKYTMLNDWSILREIQYKKIKWMQSINGQRHEQWVLHREVCPAITVLGSFFDDDGKMCIDTATTQRYYTDGAAITFNMGNTEYTHLTWDQKYFEYHIGAWKHEGRAERGI